MFMQVIEAQYSGNPKKYRFVIVNAQQASDVQVGDRCVVVNKMKDDGKASLSIATVTDVLPHDTPIDGIMPIVDIINRENLAAVTEIYRTAAT